MKESEVNILEKIKMAREKDKEVVKVIEKIKKTGVKVLKGNVQQIERDLVLKEEKIYISKDEEVESGDNPVIP